MAYWITHLRIADAVLNKLNLMVDIEKYFIGCIAADSGIIIYDERGKQVGYNPPRFVSHWTDDIPDWDRTIHYQRFYDSYVKNETNFDKKSFFLGYFIHLITDAIWIELILRPVIESCKTPEEYTIKARSQVRADWFDTELIFLLKNPEFEPLKLLKTIKNFNNIYLDYFPSTAIQNSIEEIVEIYNDFSVDANRVFPYFSYEKYEHMNIVITQLIVMNLLSR